MKYSKHIVFITPGFAAEEADFLCTPYLQDYFRALQAARPDLRISIIALQYPYKSTHYTWRGLDVYALGGHNRRWKKPWIWRRCRAKIMQLHRAQPIDVLHAFWLGETCHCAHRVGKKMGIPVIATLMGQDALPENRSLRRLDLHALKIVALSDFSARLLQGSSGRQADEIIPFGIAPADVDHHGNADRPYDLIAVSSLIPAKRIARFVRVVSQLRDQFPDLRAVLVGDGPERAKILAMIAELGLQAHLQWIPILSRHEILELMSQAKVFVHTSRIEGMGLVLAEALARGCHLVSTPVGIAEKGDKCAIADDTFTLGEYAAHFLQNPVDWEPRVAHPLATTVAGYLNLYGIGAGDVPTNPANEGRVYE